MIGSGLHTRVGPIARTVEDAARIETVMAGYDPNDGDDRFNVGRIPKKPYESFTHETSLKGMRIGVVREYMDKALFNESRRGIDHVVDKAIDKLRELGATIIRPGSSRDCSQSIFGSSDRCTKTVYAKLHPSCFLSMRPASRTGDYI